jgi:hypothetical protein
MSAYLTSIALSLFVQSLYERCQRQETLLLVQSGRRQITQLEEWLLM